MPITVSNTKTILKSEIPIGDRILVSDYDYVLDIITKKIKSVTLFLTYKNLSNQQQFIAFDEKIIPLTRSDFQDEKNNTLLLNIKDKVIFLNVPKNSVVPITLFIRGKLYDNTTLDFSIEYESKTVFYLQTNNVEN